MRNVGTKIGWLLLHHKVGRRVCTKNTALSTLHWTETMLGTAETMGLAAFVLLSKKNEVEKPPPATSASDVEELQKKKGQHWLVGVIKMQPAAG